MESNDHLLRNLFFFFQNGKFERVSPVEVTVKEEKYQQSIQHCGMQVKPPTQGVTNGTNTNKNFNNVGFDLASLPIRGLFCVLLGFIPLDKKQGCVFLGGRLKACAQCSPFLSAQQVKEFLKLVEHSQA